MSWREAVFLILGLGCGYFLMPTKEVSRALPEKPEISQPTPLSRSLESPNKNTVNKKSLTTPIERVASTQKPQTKTELHREIQTADLILNESELDALEESIPDLRNRVQVEYTDEGWSLNGDLQGTPFANFGFHTGDVIRHDHLQELKRNSRDFVMAERLENVLRRLER